jgi:hypothetical protein
LKEVDARSVVSPHFGSPSPFLYRNALFRSDNLYCRMFSSNAGSLSIFN